MGGMCLPASQFSKIETLFCRYIQFSQPLAISRATGTVRRRRLPIMIEKGKNVRSNSVLSVSK